MSDELVKRISEKMLATHGFSGMPMETVVVYRANKAIYTSVESAIREALEEANEWVSVKDRLPEIGNHVLWCRYDTGEMWGDVFRAHDYPESYYSHWRKSPELPKAPAETEGK